MRRLIPEIIQRGHEIAFLGERMPFNGIQSWIPDNKMPIFVCGNDNIKSIKSKIREWKPDFIYNHGLSNAFIEAELSKEWPVYLYAHCNYGTCLSGEKRFKFPFNQVCYKPFGSNCLINYFPRRCGGKNPITALVKYHQTIYRFKNLKTAKKVFVASSWMLNDLNINGIDEKKIFVLPYFLKSKSVNEIRDKDRFNYSCLFVGRLVEYKGLENGLLAVAFAENLINRKIQITIAGDGPRRAKVLKLANKLGLKIDLLGWLGDSELKNLYLRHDFLLFPSLWPEPFGLVGIEAGQNGLPSVGYCEGGVKDWLLPGITGEISNDRRLNPKSLALAIQSIYSCVARWNFMRKNAYLKSLEFNEINHFRIFDNAIKVNN